MPPWTIRPAQPEDAERLATIHVTAWSETYPGLLPQEEIDRRDHAFRYRQWQGNLTRGVSRVAIAADVGFAEVGPQRENDLAEAWPEELYALYVLKAAQGTGLGHALLASVAGRRPFTALALDGNHRALAFYRKTGATLLGRRPNAPGWPDDLLLGWRDPELTIRDRINPREPRDQGK